jgi:hypothetical protein
MILMATMRRFNAWIGGLFLIAQVFAVVPLISKHATHEAESALVLSNENVRIGSIPQGHYHHHGDADGFIEHHELQDLNGTLISLGSRCEIAIVRVASIAYVPDAVAEGDPILLERPPKPILSI